MNYFFVNTLGNPRDPDLCILTAAPEDVGMASHRMARGLAMGSDYPQDAKVFMTDEAPGLKLDSLIGNTKNYLIVSKAVVEVIQQQTENLQIEYLPFTLINHKKRVHSTDYYIVNPIGTLDCLDTKASAIEYTKDREVIAVNSYVLDPNKLANAPNLFRIKETPDEYVVSEILAKTFTEKGFTNIVLRKIPQRKVKPAP